MTETSGFAKYTESVWDGKYPTNAAYKVTNAGAPISAEKSLYKAANTNAMFTATQLAYYADKALASDIALYNDIDMKSLTFKGLLSPTAAVSIDGKIKNDATDHTKHKIGNLKVFNKETVLTVDYAVPMGLFNTAASALTVDHLELANVEAQTTLMPYKATEFSTNGNVVVGIGALVGNASRKVTTKYVTVTLKNQNFGSTNTANKFINVGGLIGYASAGADIQNTNVSGAPIAGYRDLGGLIGTATTAGAAYDFNTCTTNVTFSQAVANTNTMDCWYASIGGFIGLCSAKPDVTITGTNSAAAINDAQNTYWGKMYVSSTSTSDGRFYNFTRAQNYLGFSGRVPSDADYGFGTVTIGGTAQTVPATVPVAAVPANSLYYFMTEHTN